MKYNIGDEIYCRDTRDSKNLDAFRTYIVTDVNQYKNIQVKEADTGKTLEHYYKPERFRLNDQECYQQEIPKTRIGLEKQYKTRSGYEVKLFAISDDEEYPVIGQYKYKGKWSNETWTKEGKIFSNDVDDEFDLVEQKPKEYWFVPDSIHINTIVNQVTLEDYEYSFDDILRLAEEIKSLK